MEDTTTATAPQTDEAPVPSYIEGDEGADEDTPQQEERVRPLAEPARPDAGGFVWGTGRRKSSVARVRIRPAKTSGEPIFTVNGKEIDVFFTEPQHRQAVVAPLMVTNTRDNVDVIVTTKGGGYMGQAEATLLGVARALMGYAPSTEQTLRENDFLTRDPREVERKKYGQSGARRRFQFSKR